MGHERDPKHEAAESQNLLPDLLSRLTLTCSRTPEVDMDDFFPGDISSGSVYNVKKGTQDVIKGNHPPLRHFLYCTCPPRTKH